MDEKVLIVYYSRTNNSRIVANNLQKELSCDCDEISYVAKKKVGFLKAIIQVLRKSTASISGDIHKVDDYDKIIFIFPIWGSKLPTPIRSYMKKYRFVIKNYELIATSASSSVDKVSKDSNKVLRLKPSKTNTIHSSDIKK
jgi:flavodoxin